MKKIDNTIEEKEAFKKNSREAEKKWFHSNFFLSIHGYVRRDKQMNFDDFLMFSIEQERERGR